MNSHARSGFDEVADTIGGLSGVCYLAGGTDNTTAQVLTDLEPTINVVTGGTLEPVGSLVFINIRSVLVEHLRKAVAAITRRQLVIELANALGNTHE
jgi:hypothetical protein